MKLFLSETKCRNLTLKINILSSFFKNIFCCSFFGEQAKNTQKGGEAKKKGPRGQLFAAEILITRAFLRIKIIPTPLFEFRIRSSAFLI